MFLCSLAFTSISYATLTIDLSAEFLIADSGPSTYNFNDVSVYGDIVAWRAYVVGDGGICYKDLRTGEQYQISFSAFDGSPSVYEDTIVWANHDSIGGNDGIYTHDISTGITTRVVSNPPDANPTNAKIYGK